MDAGGEGVGVDGGAEGVGVDVTGPEGAGAETGAVVPVLVVGVAAADAVGERTPFKLKVASLGTPS